MSGQHTPTPWASVRAEVVGADDTLIALALASSHSWQTWTIDPTKARLAHQPEAKANVEFIVRACNAHDGLLDAAKALRQHLALFCGPDDAIANVIFEITDAAIAKAKGE